MPRLSIWSTVMSRENQNHSLDNLRTLCLTCHSRKDNRQNKLKAVDVINIRHMYERDLPPIGAEIAKMYDVSVGYIYHLLDSRWWNNLPNPQARKGRSSIIRRKKVHLSKERIKELSERMERIRNK